jgi:hypothetical protein
VLNLLLLSFYVAIDNNKSIIKFSKQSQENHIMKFPIKQTLETFLEEQVAAYQERLMKIVESPSLLPFALSCSTDYGDTVFVAAEGLQTFNEDHSHCYQASCQFTGSEGVISNEIKPRIAAMNQAIQYTEELVDKLNALGGWTPYKGM